MTHRVGWATAALLTTAFVVYGSLVPLNYTPLSFAEAWSRFQETRLLNLRLYSRADWIANGVLFFPVAFCWAATLDCANRLLRIVRASLVWISCCVGAVALEFLQEFFPGRTVSLNDIYAEMIGATAGVVAWLALGARAHSLLDDLQGDWRRALSALTGLYFVFYVLVSLFPFDFVLSFDELSIRLQRRPVHWVGCTVGLRCLAGVLIEMGAIAPLGLALALLARPGCRPSTPKVLIFGAVVGIVVESIQLFTFSGNVNVLSVLWRSVGLLIGARVGEFLSGRPDLLRQVGDRRRLALLIIPYMFVLAVGNRWQLKPPATLDVVLPKLSQMSYVPFYYHYYNPEVAALQKLLYHFAMYFPAGVMLWVMTTPGDLIRRGWIAGLLGCFVALFFGLGRLFFGPGSPDPTNLLIGTFAGVAGFVSARYAAGLLRAPDPATLVDAEVWQPDAPGQRTLPRLFAAALMVVAVLLGFTGPVSPLIMLPAIGILAFVVKRWPFLWPSLLPAMLFVTDIAASVGWEMLDSMDLALFVLSATNLWFGRVSLCFLRPLSPGLVWLALLGLSYVASVLVTVLSIGSAPNSLLVYDSPLNGLRLFVGFAWAVILMPQLAYLIEQNRQRTLGSIAAGMVLGLLMVSVTVGWERYHFTGLLDFSETFRVSGGFSGMAVGGASLDFFLLVTMPFLGYILLRRSLGTVMLFALGVALGLYSIAVTFTRTTHIAAMMAWLAALGAAMGRQQGRSRAWSLALLGSTGVVLLVIAMQSEFMAGRWSRISTDLTQRVAHWSEVSTVRRVDTAGRLFGSGLGSFVSRNLATMPAVERPGLTALHVENDLTFLRMSGGTPTYIDQRIAEVRSIAYEFTAMVRAEQTSQLTIFICEKYLMNSRVCSSGRIEVPGGGEWTTVSQNLSAGGVGIRSGVFGVPIYVSLRTPPAGHVVDIANLSFRDALGVEQLRNGKFEEGRSRWFFTNDSHSVWHVANLWLHVLIEQGWFGLIALVGLQLSMIYGVLSLSLRGDPIAVSLAGAVIATLVTGVFDSILDMPRSTFMFTLVAVLCLLCHRKPEGDARLVRVSAP